MDSISPGDRIFLNDIFYQGATLLLYPIEKASFSPPYKPSIQFG